MTTDILIFGQLTDITQQSKLQAADMPDTNALLAWLKSSYPALESAKFVMAVNGQVIQQNTMLSPGATVALLPPFSGG
jgi:molybdopterin synthase sulfur carrier subunit